MAKDTALKPSNKGMKRTGFKRKPPKPKKAGGKRKPEWRIWEEKADKLWGLVVRERDNHICQKCGNPANQPHHIFTRSYKATRHNPDNGITLCYPCHHKWAHGKPEEFRDWIINRIGHAAYMALKFRALAKIKGKYDPQMNYISLKALKGEV